MDTENATVSPSERRPDRGAPIADNGRWGGSVRPMPDPYRGSGREGREEREPGGQRPR